jgi:hypothetical protein
MALFYPDIPGAGKTVMTSIIVDHLMGTFKTGLNVPPNTADPSTGIA